MKITSSWLPLVPSLETCALTLELITLSISLWFYLKQKKLRNYDILITATNKQVEWFLIATPFCPTKCNWSLHIVGEH